jgi:hypothetical protein
MSGVVKGVGKFLSKALPVAGTFLGGPLGGAIGGLAGAGLGALTRPKAAPVAGANPLSHEAFGLLQKAGNFDVFGSMRRYMNNQEGGLVNAIQGDFDRQRQQVGLQADEMATKAHAFGGNRAGLLRSVGLGDVNRNEAQTLAGLRYQGFGDALRGAQDERNFMLAAAQGLGGAGDYLRSIEQARQTADYERPGLWQSILGGAAAGAGAAGTLGKAFAPKVPWQKVNLGGY